MRIISKVVLLALLMCTLGTLHAKTPPVKLVINNSVVDRLDVLKFNDKISSADYAKLITILLPADTDRSSNILSQETKLSLAWRFNNKNRKVVCFYLSDVKNTLLCLFNDADTMMAITGNTMLYAWAGQDINAPFFDGAPEEYRFAGADMKGKSLNERYEQIKQAVLNSCYCIDDIEKTFFKDIVEPEIKKNNKKFALLAAAVDGNSSIWTEEVITHEALHAKYFSDKNFRKIVDDYVNEGFNDSSSINKVLFACMQKSLYDTGVYPCIYTNLEKRNTELANYLLQIDTTFGHCDYKDLVRSATALYDRITEKGFKLPDLWYKRFKRTEAGLCDKTIDTTNK